jgi:hypothetical protein
MSHITTIKDVLIKDLKVLHRAITKVQGARLYIHESKPIRLYQPEEIDTVAQVHLLNWKYPVLVTPSGHVHYDNYKGRWGEISHLNKLKQMYGLEKAKKLATAQGYICKEKQKNDGAVVLELTR